MRSDAAKVPPTLSRHIVGAEKAGGTRVSVVCERNWVRVSRAPLLSELFSAAVLPLPMNEKPLASLQF